VGSALTTADLTSAYLSPDSNAAASAATARDGGTSARPTDDGEWLPDNDV
jgi:hypothetical protein